MPQSIQWTKDRPTVEGFYFAKAIRPGGGEFTTIIRAYCSTPHGELPYLGQPEGEPGREFPEHNLPSDRIYWEGSNYFINSDLFGRFAGPIPLPEE